MYWLVYLLRPLILTVIIEVGGAYLLGLRRKELLLVVLANILTNPAANAAAAYLFPLFPSFTLLFLIIEVLVILTEYLLYRNYLTGRPFRTSLILNLLSIGGGLIWQMLL